MEAVIAVDTLVKEVVVEGKKERREIAQSCPTLCNSMGYSLSGSSIHGIFQARALERVDISFSRGSSRPRDQTQVFHIAGRHLVGKEVVEMEVMVKVWGRGRGDGEAGGCRAAEVGDREGNGGEAAVGSPT